MICVNKDICWLTAAEQGRLLAEAHSAANAVKRILAASTDVADCVLLFFIGWFFSLATGFGRHDAGERKAKPRIEFITFPVLPEDNYSSRGTPEAVVRSSLRGRRMALTSPGTR